MKRFVIVLAILLWASTAGAAERAIIAEREWEQSYRAAYDMLSKVKGEGYNHVLVFPDDPMTIKPGSLEYFIHLAHWYEIRVSLVAAVNRVSDPDTFHAPGYPAYIAGKIAGYAQKYPTLDGISIDGAWAEKICATEYCQQDYALKYGRDLLTDKAEFEAKETGARCLPYIVAWNTEVMTNIVQAVSVRLRSINPNLSIGVFAQQHMGRVARGSDAVRWLNAGYVDRFYDMEYYDQVDLYFMRQYVFNQVNDPSKVTITIGSYYFTHDKNGNEIGMYSRDPKNVADIIKSIEGFGDGYCVFMYRFMR